MGDKLSRRILEQARQQQDELEEEFGAGGMSKSSQAPSKSSRLPLLGAGMMAKGHSDDDSDDGSDIEEDFCAEQFYENIVS